MKSANRSIAAAIAAIMAVQAGVTTFAMTEATAKEVASQTQASRSAQIAKAIGAFEKATKIEKKSVQVAGAELVKTISESSVTQKDILAFVTRYTTPAQAKQAAKNIEFAMKGVSAQAFSAMTESEQAMVIGEALKATNAQGLAWSGCAGLTTGVILVVAALVVGIIGVTKMAGEKRISKRFDEKRNSRTAQYNRDRDNILNREANIQTEITNIGVDIADAQNQINYWEGVLDASLANNDLAAAQNARSQMEYYENQVSNGLADIARLTVELALYNDPAYAQGRLADLQLDYNQAMASLNQQEANDIALVPENNRIGRGMMTGGAVGAAIGAYLIIDGANGC
jgi:hypothetical protein